MERMKCQEPGCEVAALEGETLCSDHLTCSTFLEKDAAAGDTKNAARDTGGKKSEARHHGLKPGTVARAIVTLLRAHERCSMTPQTMAKLLPYSKGTISKTISRLKEQVDPHGQPYIVPKGHGAWMATIPMERWVSAEAPQVCLHALQCSQRLPLAGGLGVTGPGWEQDERNGQARRVEWWGQHRVTIAVSLTTGTCQVSLRASDQAITVEGFDLFREWLQGIMRGLGLPFNADMAQLDNVELNRDSKRLVIADARRYRLQAFENVWAQAYNKEGERLRVEARISNRHADVPMVALAGALNVLSHKPLAIVGPDAIYRDEPVNPMEVA